MVVLEAIPTPLGKTVTESIGIPTIGMTGFYNANSALNAGAKVDTHNFYGSKSDYEKVDADNRLVWHMPLRRLDAEGIRDSILAVSKKR